MKRLSTAIVAIVLAASAYGSYARQAETAGAGCDDFVNARSLSGASGSAAFSNIDYTEESGEPYHDGVGNYGGASAWASWTAPANGAYTFYLSGVTSSSDALNTLLAVYTGTSLSSLSLVVLNDDANKNARDYSSRVSFFAKAGTTYKIAMDTKYGWYSNDYRGDLTLRWEEGFVHYAQLDYATMFAPVSGCETIIGVSSSTGWRVVDYPDWIVPKALSGSNGDTLSFSVLANATGAERTGVLAIQAGDSELDSLSIRQNTVDFVTTKNDAVETALRENKRILLVGGRETCPNTIGTLFYSIPDPTVKSLLDAGYVTWYSNCDRQTDAIGYASGLGSYMYPLVCILNPADMSTYVARTTGYQSASALRSLLEAHATASTVTFNPSGGTVSEATRSVAIGAAVGTLPTPTQKGYDFKGWWTAKSGGTQVTASTVVAGSVTYYAHWQAKSFTVSFVATNGKISGARSKTVKYNGTYGTLPTATQDGYNFLGWFTERSSGTQVTATTKVTATAAHTLYSHWKKAASCTVTFNATGGTVSPTTRSVASGATVGTLPTPTQKGYDFKGWWTAKSGGTQVTASTKVTANATYYAHWAAKTFTVTFIATNGKISGARSKTVQYNKAYGPLPAATQAGYDFLGWFTERSGGTQVTADTKMTTAADHTLYSHWKKSAGVALALTTGGDAAWTQQADGTWRSGKIGDRQETWLRAEVSGPGTLTFRWKVLSEKNYDWLCFSVDDDNVLEASGMDVTTVSTKTVEVTGAGRHLLAWFYKKDGSNACGSDAAWISQIKWTPK